MIEVTRRIYMIENLLILGHHIDHSVYIIEMCGIYEMILMAEMITKLWHIEERDITLG